MGIRREKIVYHNALGILIRVRAVHCHLLVKGPFAEGNDPGAGIDYFFGKRLGGGRQFR